MTQYYTDDRWNLKHYRDENGKLASFTDFGGYPIYYLDGENNILCPGCANASELPENGWSDEHKPVAGDFFEEGASMTCDQCNKEIESAYGDPEKEKTSNGEDYH